MITHVKTNVSVKEETRESQGLAGLPALSNKCTTSSVRDFSQKKKVEIN